jgi:hypothetical protein
MDLVCEFLVGDKLTKGSYWCKVNGPRITEPKTLFENVTGNHLTGKTNKDLKVLNFRNTVNFFPRGLNTIFQNLTEVVITRCGLKEISREDLTGLEKLEVLITEYNMIKSLPINLFEGMSKLKKISFRGNKLEFVSSEMFQPVIDNDFELVGFSENLRINAVYIRNRPNGCGSLKKLMEIIDENCLKPDEFEESVKNTFKFDFWKPVADLWSSNSFSDFTIVAGLKKFPVHKTILSVRSSVLAAAIEGDFKEKETGELSMDDFDETVVETFLRYLYTGEVDNEGCAKKVFVLADKYDVEDLKLITQKLILGELNESNAFEVFSLGHKHSSNELKKQAFDVIQKTHFPTKKLNELLMDKPEDLEKLIQAAEKRKSQVEMIEKEFEDAFLEHSL